MKDLLHRTFLAHPNSVEESYFQHFRFAMNFSGTLFVAACAALIHALVPAFCERTASSRINELHRRMHNR